MVKGLEMNMHQDQRMTRAGEVIQHLKTLDALAQKQSLILSTHNGIPLPPVRTAPQDPMPSGCQTYLHAHVHICTQTHKYTEVNNKTNLKEKNDSLN